MRNAESAGWEKFFSMNGGNRYPDPFVIRFMASRYFNLPLLERIKIKVLDLGCGSGSNSRFLANEGFDVIAVDSAESAILRAKEGNDYKNLKYLVGDIKNLGFEPNTFDVIIDANAIQHNSDYDLTIIYKEVCRVLKNDGQAFQIYINFERKKSSLYTNYKTSTELRDLLNSFFGDIKMGFSNYGLTTLEDDYRFSLISLSKPIK